MPSGTLESPLSTSQVRDFAKSSTLHQDTEKTGFGNSYVRTRVLIRTLLHKLLDFGMNYPD